jgi:phage terminase large subunit-like protein
MKYGVRSIEEMRVACKQAQEMPAYEMTFRRLYLNQWVNSVQRWLPMDKWKACGGEINLEELKGRPCYAGLDLSSSIDLTALALAFPRDDGFYDILVDFWLPEDTAVEAEKRDRVTYREWARQGLVHLTPGNVIDYGFIRHILAEKRALYDLRELAYDRYGAAQLIQNLEEDGFIVDPEEIKKNKFSTAPVVVPFGQGFVSMSPPTKELMTLVLQKKIRHGNNSILNWNADNMVVAQDPAGNLKPDKAKATQKIDGMVALIMALDRAIKHEGEAPSIYETEGGITL